MDCEDFAVDVAPAADASSENDSGFATETARPQASSSG